MAIIQHELRFWFREKVAETKLTQVEFRDKHGVSRAVQSMLQSDTSTKKAGLKTCMKLAYIFHTPVCNVLEMAGYAARTEPNKSDERFLIHAYRRMNARDKQTVMILAEGLLKDRPESV